MEKIRQLKKQHVTNCWPTLDPVQELADNPVVELFSPGHLGQEPAQGLTQDLGVLVGHLIQVYDGRDVPST